MKWLIRLAAAVAVLAASLLALDRLFPPPIERGHVVSTLVSDRDGRPLRAMPAPGAYWRFAADLDRIDPVFVDALLEVEDQRFWSHGGTDWVGMIRAAWSSLAAGRIVSGGSTITMQTARLLEPRPRTIPSKLIEIFRAHQIEARLSKEEILELYLTLAPYGGNVEGVRAASWRYFGREPDRLSDDQIALLIALPQSPEVRRPDLRPEGARAGRAVIASKLERLGFLDAVRAEEARSATLPQTRYGFPSEAWHATARAAQGGRGDIRSTLDRALQNDLEKLLARHAARLEPEAQIAVLVADVKTRAVRAAVGSVSRERPGGWIDLTDQPRSPGSTLKPFIYAMAFDDGEAAPDTRISDLPKRFASYQPDNFDRMFRGDVRVSDALQHSLNVPAVLALDRVGPERFAATLALAGAAPRIKPGAERQAGLALALGGAGLTLRELAILYAALGDDGIARPLAWTTAELEAVAQEPGYQLVSAESARDVLTILRNAPAPAGRVPGRLTENAPQIAFKTGTSYGFRDAWAAGVSGDQVIVVWVGRADGAPRPGETGRAAALPLLFDVADHAQDRLGGEGDTESRLTSPTRARSQGAIHDFTARASGPDILFPPKDAELWAGPINGRPARPFVLAGRGEGRLNWYIDGRPCPLDDAGLPVWLPETAGFYRVSAVDAGGRESYVTVRVMTPQSG